MKQLIIAVLVVAAVSLGARIVGTFTATAGDAPAPQQQTPKVHEPPETLQPAAVRVDRNLRERHLVGDDRTGPDSTRRGTVASLRSRNVPRSAAKPSLNTAALASVRTGPPLAPPAPPMIGPDGLVYRKTSAAVSLASALRLNPPPLEEPLVLALPLPNQDEPAPLVSTVRAPLAVHARMIGPDGIEYRAVKHGQ